MKTPLSVGARYTLLLSFAAFFFIVTAGRLPAGESFGPWSNGARVIAAMDFFERISAEFADRLRRLQEEGAASPVLPLPIVRSILSDKPGGDREIERYTEGKLGEGQTDRLTGRALAELEEAREELAAAEAKAAKAWAAKHKDGMKDVKASPEAEAYIYEMKVTARRLGVLLDNSRSMTSALPALRKTIGEKFLNTRFAEVDGCRLTLDRPTWGPYPEWQSATPLEFRNPFEPRWFLPEIPKKDIHYHSVEWERNTMAAFRSMVTLMEVDAIYWFTDFDDKIDSRTAQALEKLLTDNKVKLYVHTVKSTPPGIISSIIRRTGGNLTKAVPEQTEPQYTKVDAMPAEPVVPGFGAAHLYQWVKVAGTVAKVRYVRDADKAFLVLQENDLMLEMECRDTKAEGERMEDFFANRCKPGTRIEAFGMVTNLTRARHRLIVNRRQLKLAGPVVAADPVAPAPADVSVLTDLSSESLDRHLNKVRQLVVQSVQVMPSLGDVKIFFKGTPLYLFCRKESTGTVFPGIDPLTYFTPGKNLTVRGPITLHDGIPQVMLTRQNQWNPTAEETVTQLGEPGLIDFIRQGLVEKVGQDVGFTVAVGSVLSNQGNGEIRIWFPFMSVEAICPAGKVEEVFGKGDPLEKLERQKKIRIKGKLLKAGDGSLKIILSIRGQIGPG
jgi:hypothetical protein